MIFISFGTYTETGACMINLVPKAYFPVCRIDTHSPLSKNIRYRGINKQYDYLLVLETKIWVVIRMDFLDKNVVK